MKVKIIGIGICCSLLLAVSANDIKTEKPHMEMLSENLIEVEENVTELKEIVTEPIPESIVEEPVKEELLTKPEPIIEQPVTQAQPTEPQGGLVNEYGQVYVSGFGWLTSQGPGEVHIDYDMRMNENKVGIM